MSYDIHIPPEVQHVVDERVRIYSENSLAVSQAAQLDNPIRQVGSMMGQMTAVNSPLTGSGNPPDEIAHVLDNIYRQVNEIDRLEAEIQTTENRIAQLIKDAQSKTMLVVGGGIAALIVLALLIVMAIG